MPQTGLEMSVVLPWAPELQGLQACQSADPFKLVPVCQFVTYKLRSSVGRLPVLMCRERESDL